MLIKRSLSIHKNSIKKVALFLSGAAALTAITVVGCAPVKKKQVTEKVSEQHAAQLAAEGKAAESAAEYARIGELLLLPEGIIYADKMFDKALEIDPKNGKANFYSAITKVMMAGQGYMTRYEPLMTPRDMEYFANVKKTLAEISLPELTKMLTEMPAGKGAFGTNEEMHRAWRTEILPVVVEAGKKLRQISTDKPLEININLARLEPGARAISGVPSSYPYYYGPFTTSWSNSYTSCTKSKYSGGEYDSKTKTYAPYKWECTQETVYNYTYFSQGLRNSEQAFIDGSDIKVLHSAVEGLANYIRILTAFSSEGIEALVLKTMQATTSSDESIFWSTALQTLARSHALGTNAYAKLGTLEPDHQLVELGQSAEEVAKELVSLVSLRNEVCNNGARNKSNSLVIDICFGFEDTKLISLIADAMSGPKKLEIGYDAAGQPVKMLVDVWGFLRNPPRDLKALLPTKYNAQGKIVAMADPRFGGLFPDGDSVGKIQQVQSGTFANWVNGMSYGSWWRQQSVLTQTITGVR